MPYPRFTKIIIRYFLSKHNSISKRQGSPYNTSEDDGVLGWLKIIRKGEEHQVYRKSIPDILVTDDIQNSEAFKTFIAISIGLIPPNKGRGKGAQGTKATITPKKATTAPKKTLPKKKESKNKVSQKQSSITADDSILQDPNEALKLGKSVSLTEAEITEEHRRVHETYKCLVTERLTSNDETYESQGKLAHRPTGKRKPRGLEIDTYKAIKASRRKSIFQHQSGGQVKELVLDETKDKNEEDDESIDIENTDDERTESDNDDHEIIDAIKTNVDQGHKENAEKVEEQKADEELKADEEQQGDDQAGDEQVGVPVSTTHKKKPNLLQSTTSHSVSSNFGNRFLNNSPNVSLIVLESKALTAVLQRVSDLENDVKELKQVDHSLAIFESIKSQIKQKHVAKEKMPKYSTTQFDQAADNEYMQKDILFKMMMASKSYEKHPAHKALYDALIQSLLVDKNDMDRRVVDPPSKKKRLLKSPVDSIDHATKMAATQTTNNNSIRSIVKKEKLNGSNFLDWYRNLRIVLRNEQKLHHLEEALPEAPPATTTAVVRNAYTRRVAEQQEVTCLMLVSMAPEIQKNLEDRPTFDILHELKTMFQQKAEQELFETVKAFHACKQEEVLGVNMILTSLLKDYDQFGIPKKTHVVLDIRQGQIQKPKSQARGKGKQKGNRKSKLAYDPKHKIPPHAKKEHPAKDTECHHCHKTGHWKRNCPLSLAELKKNKASASGTSGIFTIELFSFTKSNSWIYDTGCGTHICNTIQGLKGYRKLNKGALDLYVSNGNTAAVEAIGSFDLILPSGMIFVLDNWSLQRNRYIVAKTNISLKGGRPPSDIYNTGDNGFHHKFIDNGVISISKDNICYFNAFPRDGIFEIDMQNHISNERSIYTCSNKKTKHNLDYTFLWHCRLGHIYKKRIEKLQQDRLIKSINDESFDICISCISGKMARKPFACVSERADDLLGSIHSDVCGPFRTTSREGANYYVTFTDEFSRYGYVYLIKHKHEVFEMFKTFQNEVENQLEKTIKALRSDRGGDYLSQEFLDHLRSRGIISQLTPPYTPQHNGVSERKNQTLLDMVQSMMSLTTLPMSFWGYAIESVARILNMVPTNKVNKTPYEIWHGKVLNLSYLKVWGCEALVKRDTPNKRESRSIKCIFVRYPKETMGYYFYYPLENKIFVARYAEFLETRLIKQEASGSIVDFDVIQSEDAQPSENTSLHQHKVEPDTVEPQTDVIPIRRSARIPQAPERYGFYIDAEKHELGDHGEPPNYRVALSDPESEKWHEAINMEMQSMKDNQV
ncbi:retrotransposon protein, putative, ty1-copia subclass [Tanacetum coccineum]